ncbi:glycosyltransferase family 4 protein [Sulfurimonas gotlandica]|uniref:glycosyltransferase family 4 protein n=1 Tax=Sulfurimonas gotlandica TaxID=1176482 RepID=UPI001F521E40|nr:glycosyltransferase family 4 protein [Sulfurimonas gotlandica]
MTECFYPEEFKINDIALAWKNKGYEVDVLTLVPTYPLGVVFEGYENKFYQKDEYQDINIYRVKSVTGYRESLIKKLLKYFSFMFFGTIVAIFIGRKYDYIFGFNMSTLTGMVPAVTIKKLYGKPLTFWAQDIWPDSVYAYGFKKTKLLSFFLDKFVKFMYHNITSIAISGKGFEFKLKPYVKDDLEFHYLPNWADDLDMSLESFEFCKDNKVHFTFAGNIGKVQNLENIIKAFSLLPIEYQERTQLNIIGDGSNLEELKQISSSKHNIVFHGKKPREEMAMYYKASDFLIVSLVDKPIFSVTVPAKTQTYISAKKPILAIINGETADIIKENNLGYCAHPNDVNEIKNIFIKSINLGEEEKLAFTKNCEYLTENIFNKTKIIDSLEELLVKES